MRKIMIFGDQRLASALKRILGEDAVAQTRDMASLRGEASVAVVRVHRAAELEPMRGRMRPFVAILAAADELNGRPRKKLGYRTPEELFDAFLDSVYAA